MISVVVPTYGRRELLFEALSSLARQVDAPPFEVLVIDDGADAALGVWVAGLGLPLEVRVLHHASNRGRSAARNTGIAEARGEVIQFLDSDMRVAAGFLAAHAALQNAPDVVVLGRIVTAPEIPRTPYVEYTDSRGVQKVPPGAPIPSRYFMTGNSSVAAALLARAGGFDEEFDEYGGEDTEMGYRLAAHGGKFRYAEGALAEHLDLHGVRATAVRLRRYGERMLPILVRKVPTACEELRLHYVERPARGDGAALAVRKALARVFARRAFWEPAAFLGERLPRGVRWDGLYDFIRAAAYLEGYRRSREGRG